MTRILYLTPLAPLPTTDGGRQRTNLLYQALTRLGEVSTVVINQTRHPIDADERKTLSENFGLVDVLDGHRVGQQLPWSCLGGLGDKAAHLLRGWQIDFQTDPQLQKRIKPLLDTHDLVVSRYLWSPAVSGVIGGKLPLIVDVDDRESEKVRSSIPRDISSWPRAKRWWWTRRIEQLAAAEYRLLSRCDHYWLTKQQDLEGLDGLSRWSLLPNIPFGSPDEMMAEAKRDASPKILFVGSLKFGPNRNGVQRFLDRTWPSIHAQCPQARLVIVGGSAPEAWKSVPGVELLGFVDRLDEVYAEAAFSVVPLWEGAGTKIKVLESLQRSRTLVASSYAMRGYEAHLVDGQSVLVAENDRDMAQACIRLLKDQGLASRLAAQGREQVQRYYSQTEFDKLVGESVRSILAGRR